MAATTEVERSEQYDVALQGHLDTADYLVPPDATKAARNAEWLNKLIALTPEMSQGGEEKVAYSLESLWRLKADALRAMSVATVQHFEDRRGRL